MHLYIGGDVEESWKPILRMAQKASMDGKVKFHCFISRIFLRWLNTRLVQNLSASINGIYRRIYKQKRICIIHAKLESRDEIEIFMDMLIETVYLTREWANAGKIPAKGAFGILPEEVDNGGNLSAVSIDLNSPFTIEADEYR